ncbi:unnamed protein product [Leptidea sinapis]|uniref:Uncharacterized protein n=1 Tax=Leptidea sinapis TaxID=189913 RepID=A0A5E4Q621_9NEOP|nr:unnamed protein product [Leptidea sinapis]
MAAYHVCLALVIFVEVNSLPTKLNRITDTNKTGERNAIAGEENVKMAKVIEHFSGILGDIVDSPDIAEDVVKYRKERSSDDDYPDEGGFTSANKKNDDDFIANVQKCSANNTRAPWGKCITCTE